MEAPERNQQQLSETQQRGMARPYNLTRRQVTAPTFGRHTLDGINQLVAQERNLSTRAAYRRLSGLNEPQVEGVAMYGLNRVQVTNANYGEHTTNAMHILSQRGLAQDFNAAYQMVAGLDEAQTRGVTNYGFTQQQVTAEGFGEHTLQGVNHMVNEGIAENAQEALPMVAGLNPTQIEGMTRYELDRNQVTAPEFNATFIAAMDALDGFVPQQAGSELFTSILSLAEYQVRGLGALDLSLQQVGLANGEDGLEFITEPPYSQVNGATIETTEFLMNTQSMEGAGAYDIAIQLNARQTQGITEYGLLPEQVQDAFFISNQDTILETIGQQIEAALATNEEGETNEIDLPLPPAQYAMAQAAFDTLKENAGKQLSPEDDLAATEKEIVETVAATTGVAAAQPAAATTQATATMAAMATPVLPKNLKRTRSEASLDNQKQQSSIDRKTDSSDTKKKPGRRKRP